MKKILYDNNQVYGVRSIMRFRASERFDRRRKYIFLTINLWLLASLAGILYNDYFIFFDELFSKVGGYFLIVFAILLNFLSKNIKETENDLRQLKLFLVNLNGNNLSKNYFSIGEERYVNENLSDIDVKYNLELVERLLERMQKKNKNRVEFFVLLLIFISFFQWIFGSTIINSFT
jgi:hypothetical protein